MNVPVEKMRVADALQYSIERNRSPDPDEVTPSGRYKFVLEDKDGNVKCEGEVDNLVVNQGKNHWLGVQFSAQTQITTWYMGVVDNAGFTSEVAGDTLASHAGWNEFTGYSGSRPQWTAGTPSSQSVTNASQVQFTMTAGGSIHGIFVCSVASGTSGVLWNTSDFGSPVSINVGDVLKVTYTVNS